MGKHIPRFSANLHSLKLVLYLILLIGYSYPVISETVLYYCFMYQYSYTIIIAVFAF